MKQTTTDTLMVFSIESEPGDMTRYSYYAIKEYDDYKFIPKNSTFNFPQAINKYDALGVKDTQDRMNDTANKIAEKYNCNPCTVLECIRTIQELETK